jgi:glutathione S-transferase
MQHLTLVSHHLCPYVQRAAIALAEKGRAFDRIQVDLSDKPEWFKALSPLGKVPLLKVADAGGEAVIFDSAVILEYLEDVEENPLHPEDPLERARHRSWMEFGSAVLNAIARLYNAEDDAALRRDAEGLGVLFDRVEAELAGAAPGPYFDGARFSLVDAVYGPIFRYFDSFEDKADLHLLRGRPNLAAWRRALAARESVRGAVSPDYPMRLTEFLRRRGSAISQRIAA